MKAIILAGGKGTRLEPITLQIPKALVEVYGQSILEHNMKKLLPYVDEFIIVVKYLGERIIQHIGESYQGIPVRYHNQGDEKGTGAAVKGIKCEGDIVIAYADAIFSQRDIDAVMQSPGFAVLVEEVQNPEKYGIFKLNDTGMACKVIEKPQEYIGNLANFSFFKVDERILEHVESVQESPRGEIEITDALNTFMQHSPLTPIKLQDSFLDITTPTDLLEANTLTKPDFGTTIMLDDIGDFELHLGFSEKAAHEIVAYSNDESDTALQEGTGDKKRFASLETLKKWYNDTDRYPFTLISRDGDVAGLWWGRPSKPPRIDEVLSQEVYQTLQDNIDHTHTSGIRIYPFARGKRLATPFIQSCTRIYDCIFDNVHMCIDIDAENIPSIKAFEKYGFQKIGTGKNHNTSNETEKVRYVYMRIS